MHIIWRYSTVARLYVDRVQKKKEQKKTDLRWLAHLKGVKMRPQNAIYGSMDKGKHATMMLGKKKKIRPTL